jgi:5-methylcytosine-specific restriction enzyme A
MFEYLRSLFENRTFGVQRNPRWSAVRKSFIALNPLCAVCKKADNVIAHHKKPFHLYPELELSFDNLVPLCEGSVVNCHFVFGHCFLNWKSYNPNIEVDVEIINNIRKYAKTDRKDTLEQGKKDCACSLVSL